MFVQKLNDPDRVLEIINSIRDLWLEIYNDPTEGIIGISFGSNGRYVVYNYETTKPKILEKVNNEMVISK